MPTFFANGEGEGDFLDSAGELEDVASNLGLFTLMLFLIRERESIHHLSILHVVMPLVVCFQLVSR
jgi:hypothetical protein